MFQHPKASCRFTMGKFSSPNYYFRCTWQTTVNNYSNKNNVKLNESKSLSASTVHSSIIYQQSKSHIMKRWEISNFENRAFNYSILTVCNQLPMKSSEVEIGTIHSRVVHCRVYSSGINDRERFQVSSRKVIGNENFLLDGSMWNASNLMVGTLCHVRWWFPFDCTTTTMEYYLCVVALMSVKIPVDSFTEIVGS